MAAIVENDDSKNTVSIRVVLLVSFLFAISLAYAMQGVFDIQNGEFSGGWAELILFVAPSFIPAYFLFKKSVRAFFCSLLLACGWLFAVELLLRAFF